MDPPRNTHSGASLVPPTLSAFPLFGGSGIPQAQPNTTDCTEEDLEAWQPFFTPTTASHFGNVAPQGVGLPLMISPQVAGASGAFFAPNPLLSPRNMLGDGVMDAMVLDAGRGTLIPRLNLEALNMSYSPAQFAVPITPTSTMPSSGRLSRLQTPMSSVPSSARVSSGALSPQAHRTKSAMSAPDPSPLRGDFSGSNPSPQTSARGKRRRSIYEEDSDDQFEEEDEFVGTYVPTISSARQKKKRALAANNPAPHPSR